jgi:hypothetical protein
MSILCYPIILPRSCLPAAGKQRPPDVLDHFTGWRSVDKNICFWFCRIIINDLSSGLARMSSLSGFVNVILFFYDHSNPQA